MKLITIGDVLETVEVDPEIREMFDAFSREEARWERDDDLPDTMTSRMFIAAVNWARQNPKRWEAFFLRYFCDLEIAEIAVHMGRTERYVRKLLAPVHYSRMLDVITDVKNTEEGEREKGEEERVEENSEYERKKDNE